MQRKYRLLLIVSIIGLLATLSTGTYAYLRKTETQNDINSVTILSCLDISFENLSENILIEDAYPITDAEGKLTAPYTFKVKNNCESPITAEINIETLVGSTLGQGNIKVALDTETPALLSSKSAGTKILSSSVSSNSKNLAKIILAQYEERVYDLRLWINSSVDQTQMNKTFSGKVVVVANPLVYRAIEKPNWDTSAGTLLHAIKTGKYVYAQPMTVPGKAISLATEGIISSTEDDYGTSYYFRGNVDDNYVVFANMCWRIVRITGDSGDEGDYNKAIKLVLYNYNPNNMENPCTQIGKSLAFARVNGNGYSTGYNPGGNHSATYVGYMYGNQSATTYEATHENLTDSLMLTKLKSWYNTKLRDYSDDYIADTIWCNDKRVTSGKGINGEQSTFAAQSRINDPVLTCGSDIDDNKISKFTASDSKYGNAKLHGTNGSGDPEYKIGLLTADEYSYTGMKSTDNDYYFLTENTRDGYYFTLSPCNVSSSNTGVMIGVGLYGAFYTQVGVTAVTSSRNVRPSISLKSTVVVNAGSDGTAKNPYVITEAAK